MASADDLDPEGVLARIALVAPPLSPSQRARLAALLKPSRGGA
ncbi:hypothetical protein ACWEOH_02380 [Agromyces sp. NPDC004153]